MLKEFNDITLVGDSLWLTDDGECGIGFEWKESEYNDELQEYVSEIYGVSFDEKQALHIIQMLMFAYTRKWGRIDG